MKKVCVKISAAVVAVIVAFFSLVYPAARVGAVKNDAMEYNIYNANGAYQSSYTLPKVSTLGATNARSGGIYDDDSRVVDFTKSGVCKLLYYKTNTNRHTFATAFVVDEHTIATAGHCAYDYEYATNSKSSSGIQMEKILFFDANGNVTLTVTNSDVKAIHVPQRFATYNTRGNFRSASDYALITVNKDLSAYANFNLGYPGDDIANKNQTFSCTGFPKDVTSQSNVNSTTKHAMYTGTGQISYPSQMLLHSTVDFTPGNSGGPVYLTTSYRGKVYYTVLGIVSGLSGTDKNIVTRMTTDLLHFYKNNPNL